MMTGALQLPRSVAITTSSSSSSFSPNSNSSTANSDDFIPRRTPNDALHLSFSKPSFLVRTQSNVRREIRRKPEPCCVVCDGSGRVGCHHCHGRGRTNYTDLVMLPRGEWPKWCKICGGSGLGDCSRCVGTGEYRDIMGFHFMKRESNHTLQDSKRQVEGNVEHLTNVDLLSQTPSEGQQ